MFVEVQGVKFWGEDKGAVAMDEVEQISSPLDSVIHLLRHFSRMPEWWCRQMIAEGAATQEFIEEQLAMPGSKWNPGVGLFVPEDVILLSQGLFYKALLKGEELRWIHRGQIDFCYFSWEITSQEKRDLLNCDNGVPMGTMGIVSLKDVPSHIKVEKRLNRGGIVSVVKMEMEMEMVDTDRVTITLARRDTGIIQIYSAFPGILTPPVPRERQNPEELEYNQAFWDRYALIEK